MSRPPTELRTELLAGPDAGGARKPLVILLPPSLASIDDFHSQGFVAAVRQRQLPVDLLLADITAQHVMDRSVVEILHTQVLLPARAQGYEAIWLVGISMGAFSALHYAAAHARLLAGLCLLAPYPGTADVLAELRAAGGAAAWGHTQAHSHFDPNADERAWWLWLAQQAQQGQWPTAVHLRTGASDRFISGQRLLAELLPTAHTRMLSGAHDWPTWQALWTDWLDHGPLPVRTPTLQ